MEQVVVVGAGLGGTAMAALLAHAGVPALVLDRRNGPSDLPRARMVSARTTEILRTLGLDHAVREQGRPGVYDVRVADTLRDIVDGASEPDDTATVSPTGAVLCDQDLVEALLREYALDRGARFGWADDVTEVIATDGSAEVRRGGGLTLRARFVVLAEGGRAELCRGVGIVGADEGEFAAYDEVLFRSAALDRLMQARPGAAFVSRVAGATVVRRDLRRWTLTRAGQDIDDVVATIGRAVGERVDVEVLARSRWRPRSRLADSFRSGTVFAIGDAAHSLPPTAGMAGNLAVADAHNLAWKLARVLDGRAGAGLLDTFGPERRPVARFVLDESVARLRGRAQVDRPTLQLGVGYLQGASSALVGESLELPLVDPGDPVPRVGVRLPHRWLPDGSSTLDLTGGRDFVALGAVPVDTGPVPFTRVDVPGTDLDRVCLVRPDDHVAAWVRPSDVPATVARLCSLPS